MLFHECYVPKTLSVKSLFTAFTQNFTADYSFPGEAHNFWEIVFILDGEVEVCADKNILALHRGEAILHKPMEFHRICSANRSSPQVLIFSFAADCMPKIPNRLFCMPEKELACARDLLGKISAAFNRRGITVFSVKEGFESDAETAVKELEIFLMRIFSQYGKSSAVDNTSFSKSARIFPEIIGFLENNIDKRLNVDEIAAGVGMSRSNLKKVFAKYSGVGVIYYFNMLKMSKAQRYLGKGMSISECAAKLGFSDQYYFSSVFKRIVGYPPSKNPSDV